MRKFFMLVCLMSVLLGVSFAAAQKSDNVPYLYYYSRMLGGIIIEHPDGSDSRLIGADVIPPNLTGISGPGWSPSGKYFAGYGFIYDAYYSTTKAAYVLDQAGNTVSKWLSDMNAFGMRWSPTDEDLLLIEGVRAPDMGDHARYRSFWIMDVSTGSILADDVENCGCTAYEFSPVIWETDKSRIRFYTRPETDESNRAYQITMQFDGTVLKQPITDAEFSAHYVAPDVQGAIPTLLMRMASRRAVIMKRQANIQPFCAMVSRVKKSICPHTARELSAEHIAGASMRRTSSRSMGRCSRVADALLLYLASPICVDSFGAS